MTPHQKIVRASKKGTGLRLTAGEVWQLGQDSAIQIRAAADEERAPDYIENHCPECEEYESECLCVED